jgi:serine/threonine-protein kinase
MFAVPFDLKALKVTGDPVLMVEGIWSRSSNDAPQYAISDSGTLVYISGAMPAATQPAGSTLVSVTREGKEQSLEAPPNNYIFPKISPDGTRIALTIQIDNNLDIYVWDTVRKTLTRLTFDKSNDVQPIWTSDGKRIFFASDHGGNYDIYWKAADGSGKEEKLVSKTGHSLFPFSWANEGKTLIVSDAEGGATSSSNWDIGMMSMEGERVLKPLLIDKSAEVEPEVSPDGRWIAYASNESVENQSQVYLRQFPDVDKGKWQISTNGGAAPRWSLDSRELLYLSADNSVMSVTVEAKPEVKLGVPKVLFKSIYAPQTLSSGIPWDVHPDGKRFLMIKEPAAEKASPAQPGPRKINVVLNFLEELKQRVRAK